MIARLLDAFVRWLKRLFPPDAELRRGGGPALDRALCLDDELDIEAAERGLTGRDRTDWIEQQRDTGPRCLP